MTSDAILYGLLFALLFTIIIELVVALLFGWRDRRSIRTIILAQIATNPLAVFCAYLLFFYAPSVAIEAQIPIEILVILAEWRIYRRYCPAMPHPFVFSLAANAASYITGLITQRSGLISSLF